MKFHWFLKVFVKIHVFEIDKVLKSLLLDQRWTDLGTQKVQNGSPNGDQNERKVDLKQNDCFLD